VTGSNDGTMQVYDANKNLLHSFVAHSATIEHIKLLTNGNLATCSRDKFTKIWNTSAWSLVQTFSGHTGVVYQIDQIDVNTIVSVSADGTVSIWSLSTGKLISNWEPNPGYLVYAVKFLSNGLLAVGLQALSNNLMLFNYTTKSSIKSLNGHTNSVFDFEILNATFLASASTDMKAMIWDLTATISLKYILVGHSDFVTDLKLISSKLLASSSKDKNIIIWDWTGGYLVRTLTGHTNQLWLTLDMFTDNVLISGSIDSTIKFWNITNGSLIQSLPSSIQILSLAMLSTCKVFLNCSWFELKYSRECEFIRNF
jgi:WD40 repeat protein